MEKEPKKPKEKKLSKVMLVCVESCKKYGSLVRWSGGYWTRLGCPVKTIFNEVKIPEWFYNWNTIKALVDRGILIVSDENLDQFTQKYYPVEVKLK